LIELKIVRSCTSPSQMKSSPKCIDASLATYRQKKLTDHLILCKQVFRTSALWHNFRKHCCERI